MTEQLPVARVEEFDAVDRKFLFVDGMKIGVFRVDGDFYAYENRCMHQGGPVCEGRILGKVEAVLEDDGNVVCEKFSETEKHIVCPWHGYEYDIKTGRQAGDGRFRLRRFEVIEQDGVVYLLVSDSDRAQRLSGSVR